MPTYGTEILALTATTARSLKVAQSKIEESMFGLNEEELRQRTDVTDIIGPISAMK